MTDSPAISNLKNRSEIIFIWDGQDCNPNGNPLSGANRPRIDPQTRQAVVTDVRFKRYLRDQLSADGHGIYVKNINNNGYRFTRKELFKDVIGVDDAENLPDDPYQAFLDAAVDVRMFGATLSIDADDNYFTDVMSEMPRHLTGAVQFDTARSLNPVELNQASNSLTSVIPTGEDKEEGGFGLDDHRIKYGIFPMYGVANENGTTDLREEDVERLDTLCWRAINNQTLTRSKLGQTPRLYLRVEYKTDNFQLGRLDTALDIDEAESAPYEQMRSVRDVTIELDQLVELLTNHEQHIETIHVCTDARLNVSYDDEVGAGDMVIDVLENALSSNQVREIDVYEDA